MNQNLYLEVFIYIYLMVITIHTYGALDQRSICIDWLPSDRKLKCNQPQTNMPLATNLLSEEIIWYWNEQIFYHERKTEKLQNQEVSPYVRATLDM